MLSGPQFSSNSEPYSISRDNDRISLSFQNNDLFNFALKFFNRRECAFRIAPALQTIQIEESTLTFLESLQAEYDYSKWYALHPQLREKPLALGHFQDVDGLRAALARGELRRFAGKTGTYMCFKDNDDFNHAIRILMTYSSSAFRIANNINTLEIRDMTLFQHINCSLHASDENDVPACHSRQRP